MLESVENSFLFRVSCSNECGARTLSTAEQAETALCGPCRQAEVQVPDLTPLAGRYVPVVGYRPADVVPRAVAMELDDHPQPEVRSTDPWPDEVPYPNPVLEVAKLGIKRKWRAVARYSRGYGPEKYRGAWQKEERIAVRFSAGREAVAVYRTIAGRNAWGWQSVWIWGNDLLPYKLPGITELKAFLMMSSRTNVEVMKIWCEDLTSIAENKARLKKAADAEKPKRGAKREGLQ